MSYLATKLLHQSMVGLSIAGFLLRASAGLSGAAWVRGRAARTLPHVIDTVLLASGLAMAWQLGRGAWAAPWLIAKLVGLVFYVAFGTVALRPTRPPAVRAAAAVAALATIGWMVSVAITKDPLGVLALVG